jgi:hypothetical protein
VSEVCPECVALTVHVPASGSLRVHEPEEEAVPVTVRLPFVAVTAEPALTDTTRDRLVPAAPPVAFVLPIMPYTAFSHLITGSVIVPPGFSAA